MNLAKRGLKRVAHLLGFLVIFGVVQTAHGEIKNPATPLIEVAKQYKPKYEAIKNEFKKAIADGANFEESLKTFQSKQQSLRQEFIEARSKDWAAVRDVVQRPPFEAEVNSVRPGKPRDSNNQQQDSSAPADMIFDSININPQTEIGNTSNSHAVSAEKTKVIVFINARSRYIPDGKSHIIVAPIVTWKYADPRAIATGEITELEKLVTQ